MLEMSMLRSGFYQGSLPPSGAELRRAGIDLLVLAAEEFQPAASIFEGVEVLHAPLDDSGKPVTRREWETARDAAGRVALAVKQGRNVLVTCVQGRNRSGLISALALRELLRITGRQAVRHVQTHRRNALTNAQFARIVSALPAPALLS